MPTDDRLPWVTNGQGNWLRFDTLNTEEIAAIVVRLDSDYGMADMAGRYATAWLDVARLLSTLSAVMALVPPDADHAD